MYTGPCGAVSLVEHKKLISAGRLGNVSSSMKTVHSCVSHSCVEKKVLTFHRSMKWLSEMLTREYVFASVTRAGSGLLSFNILRI